MKVKIEGALSIPNVVAAMLLGAPVNQVFQADELTLTLDEKGTQKLSNILYYLYSDRSKEPMGNNFNGSRAEKPQAPVVEPAVENVRVEVITRTPPTTEPKPGLRDSSMASLKAKSKSFIGGG